jgi:membrane-associated phospholipid phosphatase
VVLAAAVVPAGCADSRAVRRQADGVCDRLTASGDLSPAPQAGPVSPEASATAPGGPALTLYLTPRGEDNLEVAAAETPAKAGEPVAAGEKKAEPAETPFKPIQGQSFGDILKSDVKAAPSALWRGTKYSFYNAQNIVVLSLVFGADRIVRATLDDQVREELRHEHTSLHATGDFGSVIGNPALHLGIGGAWYLYAVNERDAKQHDLATTMLEALTINGLSTLLLQVSVNQHGPNGDKYGWPSGHMSSSMCFASVIHEYYGWQWGLPCYLLAGYSGASRLVDREHNLSDLFFGAGLGWVIGHSVVKGELPKLAGFYVLPYRSEEFGGLMFMRQW